MALAAATTRAPALPPRPDAEAAPPTKRDRVVLELVETERSYVTSLCTLVDCFVKPLTIGTGTNSGTASLMTPTESRLIFANVDHLYRLNSSLLASLENELSLRGPANARLGKIMFEFAPFFRVYMSFIDRYQQQSRKLEDLCQEKSGLLDLLAKCEANPRCGGLVLKSFLIMPVQRIPRYKMLLHELAKRTPCEHPDADDIKKATMAISRVASQINQSIKQQENRLFMFDLRVAIMASGTGGMDSWLAAWPGEDLLESHRRLVRVGKLVKRSRSKRSNQGTCLFVLLNDTLMYGDSGRPVSITMSSGGRGGRSSRPSTSSTSRSQSVSNTKGIIPPSLNLRAAIPLWTATNRCHVNCRREEKTIEFLSDMKSFDIVCNSEAEADAWSVAILEAIAVCSKQLLEAETRKKWGDLRNAIIDGDMEYVSHAVRTTMLTAKAEESDALAELSLQLVLKSFSLQGGILSEAGSEAEISAASNRNNHSNLIGAGGAGSASSVGGRTMWETRVDILKCFLEKALLSAKCLEEQFELLIRAVGDDGETVRAGVALDIVQSILLHRVSPQARDRMIAQVSGPGRFTVVVTLAPHTSSAAKEEAFRSAAGALMIRAAIDEESQSKSEGAAATKESVPNLNQKNSAKRKNRRKSLTMHTKAESAFDLSSSAECLDVVRELAPSVPEQVRLSVLNHAACEGSISLCATLVPVVTDETRLEVLRTLRNRPARTMKPGISGPGDQIFEKIVTLFGSTPGVLVSSSLSRKRLSSVGQRANQSRVASLTPMARQLLGAWEIHEGLLCKRGAVVKSWKTRMFALKGPLLTYHRPIKIGNNLSKELGRIDLAVPLTDVYVPTKEEEKTMKLRALCFAIRTPDRTYFVQANSVEDRQKWVASISLNIQIAVAE